MSASLLSELKALTFKLRQIKTTAALSLIYTRICTSYSSIVKYCNSF